MNFEDAVNNQRAARKQAETEREQKVAEIQERQMEELALFETIKDREIISVLEKAKSFVQAENHFAEVGPFSLQLPPYPKFAIELSLRKQSYPDKGPTGEDFTFRLQVWFTGAVIKFRMLIPNRWKRGEAPDVEKEHSLSVEMLSQPGTFGEKALTPFMLIFDRALARN